MRGVAWRGVAEDEKKAGLLRSLPSAAERLRLFQADIYDADTFEPAIAGCEFVFLVATPLAHDPTSTKVLYHRSPSIPFRRESNPTIQFLRGSA
jgi:hypothetical protein